MKKYGTSLDLLKLQNAFVKKFKSKSGQEVECVVIPIDQNYLVRGEKGLYLNADTVIRDDEDQYGNAGFVAHKAPSNQWKAASQEEKDKMNELNILGNLKDFGSNQASTPQGSEPMDASDNGADDLPF